MAKFLLGVIVSVLLSCTSATNFTLCGPDNLGITSLTVNPDPIVPGKELDVAIRGESLISFPGGSAHLAVKLYGTTIATKTFDLCKDLSMACPIAAGDSFEGDIRYKIPSGVPGGMTIDAQVDLVSSDGDNLSCVAVDLRIHSLFFI